jgi:hypothetical protein
MDGAAGTKTLIWPGIDIDISDQTEISVTVDTSEALVYSQPKEVPT